MTPSPPLHGQAPRATARAAAAAEDHPTGSAHSGPTPPAAAPGSATKSTRGRAHAALPCTLEVDHRGRTVLGDCSGGKPLPRGETGARAFLTSHATSIGLREDLADLETVEVKNGIAGTRTLFVQTLEGLPVHDAHVSVHQDLDGAVNAVYSDYRTLATDPPTRPSMTPKAAEAVARDAAGVKALRNPSRVELVWFPAPGDRARLAWRLFVYSADPVGDFLTVIDDASAKVVLQENRISFATGSGFVFQPNPIQTSGDASLSANNDNTSPTLDAERVNVTLLGLDDGVDTLRGEYVDLVSLSGGRNVPDADEASRVYEYDRGDARFEQVVIYATVDALQRYFHALGFDDDVGVANGIRDFPTLANAHWDNADQSFYSIADNAIHFGDGGVDDGEDGDIIAHEFGHAVQHDQNACWGGGEMGAMGEGFGDYLAASFFADTGDATFQSANAACVGEWDASSFSGSTPPCLRRVDGNKIYPTDLNNSVHDNGEIWSRALWDIRQALTGPVADQLVLEHHFLVPCNASMPDAAGWLIQADTNLNGGANEAAIRTAFCDRGILSGASCTISSPLSLTQAFSPDPPVAGQAVTLTLTATNISASTILAIVFTGGVPAGSTYVADSASDGGSESGATVSWPAVDLAAGAQLQRSFSVVLDTGPGSSILFEDDMEGGGALWSVSHDQGSVDWSLTTDQPHAGTSAWFASEPDGVSDQFLTTANPIAIQSGSTLSFWHAYDTESNYDGAVVEASTDSGANWTDLGGASTQNGYSGTINLAYQSPIAGRSAFTGDSNGYVQTEVDLQTLAGENAFIRFRMASDTGLAGNGWLVDDVEIGQVVFFESTFGASGGATATSTSAANVQPPPPNNTPQLTINTGLSLVQSETAAIGSAQLSATDADAGDVLTYSIVTPPANGTLGPANGFTQTQIDAGGVSYQHDGGSSTSDSFEFTLSDGNGGTIGTTAFSITITPANQPPSLGLTSLPDATVNVVYLLTVTPTDPDPSDSLSLVLVSGPSWLGSPVDLGGNTWTLTGTPSLVSVGASSITLRVSDSGAPSLNDQATLSLVVQPPPTPVPSLGGASRIVLPLLLASVALMFQGAAGRRPISANNSRSR